jgi:hypothetical protein
LTPLRIRLSYLKLTGLPAGFFMRCLTGVTSEVRILSYEQMFITRVHNVLILNRLNNLQDWIFVLLLGMVNEKNRNRDFS